MAWLILHWGILPHINEWRPQIEMRASRALGVPVAIGHIEVQSAGWVPALSLTDVRLSDHQGREALRLPKVAAALSPQSLLTWSLRFSQLYIEGAQLEVRRDAQGALHVAGMDMGGASLGQDGQEADWFFRQHEFVIRGGSLRWVDELRQAPALTLSQVDLVVRNTLRHHDLRLDATPPEGWGDRFSLRGRFTQPLLAAPSDWARWSGTAHADLPHADVARLQQHAVLPFELQEGTGGLRLWLDIRQGQWRSATMDLALDEVQLRLAPALEPLTLGMVAGRLQADRRSDGVRLFAQGLSFVTSAGQTWPASQMVLDLQQVQQPARPGHGQPAVSLAPVTGGTFSADRLDLALLASIAERLPLPDAVRQGLLKAAPQGVVQGLNSSWSGPVAAPLRYRVQAKLNGLVVLAQPDADPTHLGRPGVSGADLELDANETGGEGRVAVRDGTLTLPGVFDEPEVPLSHFSSLLSWHVQARPNGQPAGLDVQLKNARLANADLQTEFQARWQTGAGTGFGKGGRSPGVLDLTGRLTGLSAARVPRYLPRVVGSDTLHYLSRALVAGRVKQLNYRLRGDLWDFPFARPQDGEFRAAAQVDGLDLAYAPAHEAGAVTWPALSQLSGEVTMDRDRLLFRNAQGHLWGMELKGVNGQIADLMHHPVLSIDGTARGPLSDGLRFMAESPLSGMTGHALDHAVASGPAELRLGLTVPLLHVDQTAVKGQLTLGGNDLRLRPDVPALNQARGKVDFTQHGFAVSGGSARLLGGDASFDGAMQPDGSLRFQGQGTASAEGLRAAPELGVLSRLAGHLAGQAAYRVQLGIVRGQVEMQVNSTLVGMSSALPEPLAKPADQALPLQYQTALLPAANPDSPLRDSLRVDVGRLVQAEFQRDLSGPEPRVLRGAVALGQPLPSAQPGMVLGAFTLGQVNLDAWQAVAATLSQGSAEGVHSSYEPTDLEVQARELIVHGRRLTHLDAQLQRRSVPEGELWRVRLQSDQAQGQADYLPATATPGSGRLHARLTRLAVPQSDAEAVDSLIDQASNRVPALDIVVDDFELKGKKLGRLEVEAAYQGALGRDWRLTKLNLGSADARLTGSGQWSTGARRRMALNFQLDVHDGGNLLERLGVGRVVRGVTGQVHGSLAWNGSPLSPEWSQMTGQMQLTLDKGQFLKVQPGAARLLGVLSLQSLPRRFLLDFRDLFQEGFAFDSVNGDVALADGVARTGNLRIRGVQAVVLMEGQANLRQETQDLHVYVVPELNAGTASLAYAAINPVIGLGTFLAQVFLRNPLREAGTREFRIDGSWSDPVVTDLERHGDVPLPVVDAPAASASSPPRAAP